LVAPEALDAEHRVFAGTINGAAALTAVVTKQASESTLARVVKMVAEPRPRSRRRSSSPIVSSAPSSPSSSWSSSLLFAWVVIDEPFARASTGPWRCWSPRAPARSPSRPRAPCLSGVARAARAGVLVKGGAHLESLGSGSGHRVRQDRHAHRRQAPSHRRRGPSRARRRTSYSPSQRPSRSSPTIRWRARSLKAGARRPGLAASTRPRGVEAVIGYGVRATVDGAEVTIGKPGLFTRDGRCRSPSPMP
jgi:Cd2+/Zn2+-exporting ATPase